jgi:methylmalonyl-CoA/ethylmalonyl-CoA epimerase
MNQTCTVNYIDHVGVAVKDIDRALKLFQQVFHTPPARVEELADQGVRAALVQVGQTRLELLEPLSEDSAVGRFIQRRGEGLHHLALNVDDIAGKLKFLDALGMRLIDREPREGLSGTIAFVHPSSVFGVLTELVESNPGNVSPDSGLV